MEKRNYNNEIRFIAFFTMQAIGVCAFLATILGLTKYFVKGTGVSLYKILFVFVVGVSFFVGGIVLQRKFK